jgi:hypothetical protein
MVMVSLIVAHTLLCLGLLVVQLSSQAVHVVIMVDRVVVVAHISITEFSFSTKYI